MIAVHSPALPKTPGSRVRLVLLTVLLCLLQGCAVYKTVPLDEIPLDQMAHTRQQQGVRVSVAVLGDEDARGLFGIDLGKRWIQAVWVEVENRGEDLYWLLPSAVDPDVFAPDEVAYSARFFMSPAANDKMVQHFRSLSFQNPIAPDTTRSGFLLVPRDEGDKEVDIVLMGQREVVEFEFFLPLPGLQAHSLEDVRAQYGAGQSPNLGEQELRQLLRSLPCCTTDKTGDTTGDPLNLVLVGNPEDIFPAFVRRGWHPAEETYAGSVWKTIGSFIFGRQYRYSPISPMYLFGRKQDIGQQKSRGSIHQRNHLRLWLSPWRWQHKDVWLGTISRDIGVRLTTKTPFLLTHKIDPDVDEARNSFTEGMLFSGRLVQTGHVAGAGQASADQPGHNLTGDPYFHDGLRAVQVFDQQPILINELEFLDWAASVDSARHLHSQGQGAK